MKKNSKRTEKKAFMNFKTAKTTFHFGFKHFRQKYDMKIKHFRQKYVYVRHVASSIRIELLGLISSTEH